MDDQKTSESKQNPAMNMKIIMGVIVILIVAVAGYMLVKSNGTKSTDDMSPATQIQESQSPSDSMQSSDSATSANVKEFTVSGSSFKFEPSSLKVKKGDTVKITFKNSGGMHNFVIDDFNVQSKTIKSGETDTVQFTADKTGTFEYYCSVANHRAMGMKGSLIVE